MKKKIAGDFRVAVAGVLSLLTGLWPLAATAQNGASIHNVAVRAGFIEGSGGLLVSGKPFGLVCGYYASPEKKMVFDPTINAYTIADSNGHLIGKFQSVDGFPLVIIPDEKRPGRVYAQTILMPAGKIATKNCAFDPATGALEGCVDAPQQMKAETIRDGGLEALAKCAACVDFANNSGLKPLRANSQKEASTLIQKNRANLEMLKR